MVQESQPPEDTTLGNDAKKRKIPTLVMWYLLVTDRLRHIFINPKEVALMTWWDIKLNIDDDVIAHPTDASQWQDFNMNNPLFSFDPRNVRFALSTNGMNPFNETNSDHSTWLVILSMYNIPDMVVSEEKVPFPHCSCFWPSTTRLRYGRVPRACDVTIRETVEDWGADV